MARSDVKRAGRIDRAPTSLAFPQVSENPQDFRSMALPKPRRREMFVLRTRLRYDY